jgi:hypothetical protein
LQNEFRLLLIGTQPPPSAKHTAHNKVRTGQRSRRARRLGRRACKHHGPIRRCRRLWWWAGLSPSCHQPSHESSRPGGRTISLSLLSNRLYRISFRTTRYRRWTKRHPRTSKEVLSLNRQSFLDDTPLSWKIYGKQ